ncbi:MAG TPA: hypothetical protein VGN63_02575 [Flavisolibacter sp.]|jgi:hypothetical protein|nr:hypothetical protein [Flavisolibacter sp.]
MKQIFLLITLLGIVIAVTAQEKGTVKIYGYYQPVSAGKAPEMDRETGLQTSGGQGKNYFLYAVSSTRVYPAEIWIEGTRMGVSIRTIASTPVMYGNDANIGSPKQVLVPQTTQRVTQLILTRAVEGKDFGTKAESLAQTNAVVLVYKQGGKFQYSVLPALTALGSAAAQ